MSGRDGEVIKNKPKTETQLESIERQRRHKRIERFNQQPNKKAMNVSSLFQHIS